jgi:predicted Zn-dependent peptidase
MKVKFEIHDLREVAYLIKQANDNLNLARNILDRVYIDSDMVENERDNITDNINLKIT